MEVCARVRRAVQVNGMSIRQAAREFGLARKTIRKMLAYSVPPGYELVGGSVKQEASRQATDGNSMSCCVWPRALAHFGHLNWPTLG